MEDEQRDSIIDEKPPINTTKNGMLSIIGAVFHGLGLMSMMVYMGFSTYMISYLRYFQNDDEKPLSLNYTYFLMPILNITIGIGIPFSGVLEFKLGTRLLILYSSFYLILCCIIQYFSKVVFLNFFAIFLFAIGFSLSVAVTTKNACMYFPKSRGLITGILALIQAIFTAILNIVGEKIIINPQSIDPVQGFYPYEAAKNVKKFYIFQICCVSITTIIGVSLIVGYKLKGKRGRPPKKDEINADTKEPLMPEDNEEKEENNENKDIVEVPEKDSGVNYSTTQVKSAAKSIRVWRLFFMNIFCSPLNDFIMITWRPIAIYKLMPTYIIQNVNSYTSLTQMIAKPLFGFLSDKFSYRVLRIILGIINITAGLLFYFSFENVKFFVALIVINSFASNGIFSLNNPHYMKVFGMKHVIEISGIIGLAGVIMGPICSISAFFIEQNLKDSLDEVYKYMFIISSALYIFDIVLTYKETEEPLFD